MFLNAYIRINVKKMDTALRRATERYEVTRALLDMEEHWADILTCIMAHEGPTCNRDCSNDTLGLTRRRVCGNPYKTHDRIICGVLHRLANEMDHDRKRLRADNERLITFVHEDARMNCRVCGTEVSVVRSYTTGAPGLICACCI